MKKLIYALTITLSLFTVQAQAETLIPTPLAKSEVVLTPAQAYGQLLNQAEILIPSLQNDIDALKGQLKHEDRAYWVGQVSGRLRQIAEMTTSVARVNHTGTSIDLATARYEVKMEGEVMIVCRKPNSDEKECLEQLKRAQNALDYLLLEIRKEYSKNI